MEYPEISARAKEMVRLGAPVVGVGVTAAQDVHELRVAAARYITLLEQVQREHPAAAREAALAITHVQTATFFAVFAATSEAQ